MPQGSSVQKARSAAGGTGSFDDAHAPAHGLEHGLRTQRPQRSRNSGGYLQDDFFLVHLRLSQTT